MGAFPVPRKAAEVRFRSPGFRPRAAEHAGHRHHKGHGNGQRHDGRATRQARRRTGPFLLVAPSSPEFLSRHEARLLANGGAMLKRIIYLPRVACMTGPTWLPG